ncbi:hypothetical protein EGR_02695 [Echinococcus granulosus]|uniref:Uncharacterized protein n=1 Tax=Echinococcus granulosus TaxID=6210 RepID=W6UN66_ECHGR|nr:hypothetical protein EGR_02695 [Echinococcus granulosus]EUB62563.1 hypothetical protein EGR_02695 [Echinococcus granulosus]
MTSHSSTSPIHETLEHNSEAVFDYLVAYVGKMLSATTGKIDSLEDIYQRRLVVTGNRSDVQLEDEGNFACQARIMHSRLSTSADARESGWNRSHRTTGQSVMMIVRSKEAHLTVFSPLKRFGLFVGKFLTRPEVMAGSASRQEPKIFVQIGKPIYLTCFSDDSRPPALLEINFNDEIIVLSSRNRTACKRMEESHWCVGNATSFHHAVLNLLVTEYRKYIHTIKGESVRLILELLVKGEFTTPLSVKCEVKNVEKFTESGPLRKPFKAVASSTIHLHEPHLADRSTYNLWLSGTGSVSQKVEQGPIRQRGIPTIPTSNHDRQQREQSKF